MQRDKVPMRIRIDVDYPYPSRIRSFFYTLFGARVSSEYLKNCKIIAEMINKSQKDIVAYWFFTSKTIPDEELFRLINNRKHEIAMHIVNDPVSELRLVEEKTGKKIRYFTIHGTARLLTRVVWRRFRSKSPKIPKNYPLQSFHDFPTLGLDSLCYMFPTQRAYEIAIEGIMKNEVIYFHPDWLFQKGTMNHRGPFYDVLGRILENDQ